MSWFGDLFKHMNLDLCLGGSGQRIDIAASTGSRFGYNQGFMCNQFGNRGCDVRIDQNCYGYGRPVYGSTYGDEVRAAAALHRQEVALMHDANAQAYFGRGIPGYPIGGDGCFGRSRGGLSADFNIGANNMRCFNGGQLALAGGGFSPQTRGPDINISLRNLRF